MQIEWDRLIKNRPIALATCKRLPKYLLYPEILQFLDICEKLDDYYLFYTMWVSGSRINEVLKLTPSDFYLEDDSAHIMLPNLKPSGDQTDVRFIPLHDREYIAQMKRYIYTRMNESTKKITPKAQIWQVTDRGVNKKIKRIAEKIGTEAFEGISSKTFRHSYAINHLIHGIELKVVAGLLGHTGIESTEVYTQVLMPEVGHLLKDVQFSSPNSTSIGMSEAKKFIC